MTIMTENKSIDITKNSDANTQNMPNNVNSNANHTYPITKRVLMDGPYPWRTLKLAKEDAADFWSRFAAHMIDTMIIFMIFLVLFTVSAVMIAANYDYNNDVVGMLIGLSMLFWFYISPITLFPVYYALFESSKKAATPGKQIVGIVVINKHAGKIGFWAAMGKCCIKNFTFLLIISVFTDKKQALHDLVLGSFVVKKRSLLNVYTYNYPFLIENNFKLEDALLTQEELNYLKTTQQVEATYQQTTSQIQTNQSVPPSIVV